MADLTKTISNSLRTQGPGVASLWGVMVWGVDPWGNTKDTKVNFGKYISDSVVSTTSIYRQFGKAFSNSFSISSRMNLVSLTDSNGYTYVLQGGVTDPDDRVFPSYTADTANNPVYTEDTPNNPSWSQA